jgi:hypothetical protein
MGAGATCDDAIPSSAKFEAAVCACAFFDDAAYVSAFAVWTAVSGFGLSVVALVGKVFPMPLFIVSGMYVQRRS